MLINIDSKITFKSQHPLVGEGGLNSEAENIYDGGYM